MVRQTDRESSVVAVRDGGLQHGYGLKTDSGQAEGQAEDAAGTCVGERAGNWACGSGRQRVPRQLVTTLCPQCLMLLLLLLPTLTPAQPAMALSARE